MSIATLNQFYQEVVSDQALQQRFQSVTNRAGVVNMAVELSQENGYNFTSKEVEEWLNTHSPDAASGELKDEELEAVAGGKDNPNDEIDWGLTMKVNGSNPNAWELFEQSKQ
ncbi:Nif11-like leader peptide family RiPP precursor [Microcoleus sp. AT3-A2]|uniref:Nif11-like leader peptide family RiPP precursor n=1 Tax=unclassified Microcoleus TaxID=2642155 RepID=UPI002FCE6E94